MTKLTHVSISRQMSMWKLWGLPCCCLWCQPAWLSSPLPGELLWLAMAMAKLDIFSLNPLMDQVKKNGTGRIGTFESIFYWFSFNYKKWFLWFLVFLLVFFLLKIFKFGSVLMSDKNWHSNRQKITHICQFCCEIFLGVVCIWNFAIRKHTILPQLCNTHTTEVTVRG